jgi:aerobic-type carbon monoxide dehydrogenase small subunit (CoxS/CutS family)
METTCILSSSRSSTMTPSSEAEAGWPSAVSDDLTASHITLDDDEIRERMSGNLCRCAAYANIVPAIREVAQQAHEALQIQQVGMEAQP